jgi:hypothetical protein
MPISVISKDDRRKATVNEDGSVRYYSNRVSSNGNFWHFERETHPVAPLHVILNMLGDILNGPHRVYPGR